MKLSAIVAHDPNRLIGANGDLPWHLPADLAFFKKTTSGHPIVMGRKTFDSIGRALPKRENIVLTRDPDWTAKGVIAVRSPDEITPDKLSLPGPAFIIGGAEIYRQFLPLLDEIIVTLVKKNYEGDTYFPEYEHQFEAIETLLQEDEFEVIRFAKKG